VSNFEVILEKANVNSILKYKFFAKKDGDCDHEEAEEEGNDDNSNNNSNINLYSCKQ
jgi:hypothetical protein